MKRDCFGRLTKPARWQRALPGPAWHAFTILELSIVMAIIILLAGLILSTSMYVQNKGNRSRAEAEIAAISAALESYKADNGIYPNDGNSSGGTYTKGFTDNLDAKLDGACIPPPSSVTTSYSGASLVLYRALSGDFNNDTKVDAADANFGLDGGALGTPSPQRKTYFSFKPAMLGGPKDSNGQITGVRYLKDPFGNIYGCSTADQGDLNAAPAAVPTHGYNPTFDLWSTAGTTSASAADQLQWIKNW